MEQTRVVEEVLVGQVGRELLDVVRPPHDDDAEAAGVRSARGDDGGAEGPAGALEGVGQVVADEGVTVGCSQQLGVGGEADGAHPLAPLGHAAITP